MPPVASFLCIVVFDCRICSATQRLSASGRTSFSIIQIRMNITDMHHLQYFLSCWLFPLLVWPVFNNLLDLSLEVSFNKLISAKMDILANQVRIRIMVPSSFNDKFGHLLDGPSTDIVWMVCLLEASLVSNLLD